LSNFDNIIGQSDEYKSEIIEWGEDLYPLAYNCLEPPKVREYRQAVCEKRNISLRTLRRYIAKMRKNGINALFRQVRSDRGKCRKYDDRLTTLARNLLSEFTLDSVKDVLAKLRHNEDESTRRCAESISVSTLYQKIIESGFDFSKRYTGQNRRYHQFEAPHAHALWQGDAKDGIYLPDPANPGKMTKTYLFAWIDDFSRKIMYAKYYFDEQLPRLEDAFRQAVLRWGLPKKIYCDNGSVYISKHFAFLAGELGVVKIHHKPFHSWAKGKIERWNRRIDKFQQNAEKAGFLTIEELNGALHDWLEVEYHSVVHGTTGETPNNRFKKSVEEFPPRRIEDFDKFDDLFLQREIRVIDKYGRIHLFKNEYRVEHGQTGSQVEVRFSPFDLKKVKIYSENKFITIAEANKLTTERISQPEETNKPTHQISKEAVNFFSRMREEHNKMQKEELANSFRFSNL
jgi:transposase InsO family protein